MSWLRTNWLALGPMASWSVVGYCTWLCQLVPATRVLIQAQKADKASELVRGTEPPGYARTLYEQQDDWLKRRNPLAMRMEDLPADNLVWKNGSVIQAVAKGANQVRQYHPTIVVFDEGAHLEEFETNSVYRSFGGPIPHFGCQTSLQPEANDFSSPSAANSVKRPMVSGCVTACFAAMS